jgi:hypothetical protein
MISKVSRFKFHDSGLKLFGFLEEDNNINIRQRAG